MGTFWARIEVLKKERDYIDSVTPRFYCCLLVGTIGFEPTTSTVSI